MEVRRIKDTYLTETYISLLVHIQSSEGRLKRGKESEKKSIKQKIKAIYINIKLPAFAAFSFYLQII